MYGRRGAAPDNRGVCKFWQQGNCRFGRDCKFRHEDDSGSSVSNPNNSNRNQNNNFLNNNNNNNNNNNSNNNNNNNNSRNNNYNYNYNNTKLNKHNPFFLDKDAIKADLTPGEEKPRWPLSAYGPGRDAPLQLIESPYEVSPEEMRVQCYLARANGQFDAYVNSEVRLGEEASAKAAEILGDLDTAIRFVQEGESNMADRRRQVTKNTGDFLRQSQAFGRPSQIAPPTGLSSFGDTSHANQNPAFPSQLGAQGAFQEPQPAALGGAPAFGQPTAIGTSAFGRPSQPAFGQSSQPAQSSSGQPSQPSQSAFGQPSQPAQSTFGQPSQPTQSSFGQPSQQNQPAFGQPSRTAQSTFGQPSQTGLSSVGQASQQNQSPFGQPSRPAFGQPAQPAGQSIFGQPSQPAPSPFGQASQQNARQPNAFGGGNAQIGQQPPPTPSTPARTGGPGEDAEGPPGAYEGPLGEALKNVYKAVWDTNKFPDLVPEIPPKREWISPV